MNPEDFLRCVQSHIARVAVGPSAVRGKGNKGVVLQARNFLREVKLGAFATADPGSFARVLDAQTEALRASLPHDAQHWGIARKVLNLFLRDCFYTGYLRDAHQLTVAEHHFEIPLDSVTGQSLMEIAPELPAWPGVKYLTKDVSTAYQQTAANAAREVGIARVHLDALWWSVGRDEIKIGPIRTVPHP